MTRHLTFEGYDEVCIKFLSSYNRKTMHTYKSYLKLFLAFTQKTGQQIINSKKTDIESEFWELKIIEFNQWMKNQKTKQGTNYSDNAVKIATNSIRSFFDFYKTPLKLSQSEKRKLNSKPKRVTQDYWITNQNFSKMLLDADLREKYIILAGKSFGLRAGDFIKLTYGTFRSIDLSQEPPVSIGIIQTEKETVDAHPFIDSDALPIIKEVLERNKNKPSSERIITIKENELSTILQRLATEANIDLGGKKIRFHCLRKYLINNLTNTMSESKWKQIIGKALPEQAYVNDSELRECYLITMKATTINANGNGKVSKLSEQISDLTIKNDKNEKIINALVQDSNKKDLEFAKQNQEINELKSQLKTIEPLMEWVDSFKKSGGLSFFLEKLRNADTIRLPPDEGSFAKIDLTDEDELKIDELVKITGKTKFEVMNECLEKGIDMTIDIIEKMTQEEAEALEQMSPEEIKAVVSRYAKSETSIKK